MDCSPPDSSVYRNLQARILEWVPYPFSRGFSWPRDATWVSCIAGRFFTVWDTREAGMVIGNKKCWHEKKLHTHHHHQEQLRGLETPYPLGMVLPAFSLPLPRSMKGWLSRTDFLVRNFTAIKTNTAEGKEILSRMPPNRLNSIEKLFISKMKTCPRKTVHLSLTSNVYALLHNLASMLKPIASFDSIYCSMKSEIPPQTQMRKHTQKGSNYYSIAP